jgi:transcription elongation factor/antiterminator RfaH
LKRAWYALHTRNRFENVVYEGLERKSLEVFFPKILVVSKRRDRRKIIRVPMFPGYIFVKTDLHPNEHLEILKTTGSVRLIGMGSDRIPTPIPDDTVDSLKIMAVTDAPILIGTQFQKGEKVVVVSGPFTGVVGEFCRYKGADRVIVNIEVLGQFAAVEVAADEVEQAQGMLL